jgi:hypothetical protein
VTRLVNEVVGRLERDVCGLKVSGKFTQVKILKIILKCENIGKKAMNYRVCTLGSRSIGLWF